MFNTGNSTVFDQSHIFFDGAWGATLAEIMTNEALSWAVYLQSLPAAQPGPSHIESPAFQFQHSDMELVSQAAHISAEATAETEATNLKAILTLRKQFKQRNDLIRLTVNDILVLYRAIHAAIYQPDPDLLSDLKVLANDNTTQQAAQAALDELAGSARINPSILIPVDASQGAPRERLYPMALEVPLIELDLLTLHQQTTQALDAYQQASGDRSAAYAEFDERQRAYLAALAGFGAVMSRAKQIAITGESASVGTIKMLAHMPAPLQRLLDEIPGRFDVLNDIIKGREVFSNVGAVAASSTLTRFITAKDDNDKKTLAWGVLTDASRVMRITLRDFRPHVGLLQAAGRTDLANRMAQDYLDAYTRDLNTFIADLRQITASSRESRLSKPESLNA